MNRLFRLFASLALANAARVSTFLDAECTRPITDFLAFTDVCTWGADSYNGAFAISGFECSSDGLTVSIYNATESPTCQGEPLLNFSVNDRCTQVTDFYVVATDSTCLSENTTYNILAHFDSHCTDGGLPFSIQLGESGCQGGSFGPSFFSFDTSGTYSDPYYIMDVFNTTDGTCKDTKAIFTTKSFPAMCLKPSKPFYNISLDIYNAFPLN